MPEDRAVTHVEIPGKFLKRLATLGSIVASAAGLAWFLATQLFVTKSEWHEAKTEQAKSLAAIITRLDHVKEQLAEARGDIKDFEKAWQRGGVPKPPFPHRR